MWWCTISDNNIIWDHVRTSRSWAGQPLAGSLIVEYGHCNSLYATVKSKRWAQTFLKYSRNTLEVTLLSIATDCWIEKITQDIFRFKAKYNIMSYMYDIITYDIMSYTTHIYIYMISYMISYMIPCMIPWCD